MVMFSIIQLGFTRFLTDRKEWIYLPPLRYMCVWCVVGYPTSGGVLRGFGCHFGFWAEEKIIPLLSVYAPRQKSTVVGTKTGIESRRYAENIR